MRVRIGAEGSMVAVLVEAPILETIRHVVQAVRALPLLLRPTWVSPWRRRELALRAELVAREAEVRGLREQVAMLERHLTASAAEPECRPQEAPAPRPTLSDPAARATLRACLIDQEVDRMLYELRQVEVVPARVVEVEPGSYRRVGGGSTRDWWAPWLAEVAGVSGVKRARAVVEAAANRRRGPVWERLRAEAVARLEGRSSRPGQEPGAEEDWSALSEAEGA